VIQGFMQAHHTIEKSGKGFGKTYWGNKWRFKIFDGFYTHPKDPETGLLVDVSMRFFHCMNRLEAAVEGTDPWLNKQFEIDEDIKKEIKDPEIVKQYCKIWVESLRERAKEVADAQAIRRAASQ